MALALVYLLAIWRVYELFVSPTYSYVYYTYAAPTSVQIVTASILGLVCVAVLPIDVRRPSQVVIWMLFLLVVGPCLVILPLMRPSLSISADRILGLEVALVGCFALLNLISLVPVPRLPLLSLPRQTVWTGILLFFLLLYLLLFSQTGIRLQVSDLGQVYATRALFTSTVTGVAGYAAEWLTGLINPMLMAYGLARRRYRWLALGIVGELVMYLLAAYKLALFVFPLVAWIFWLLRDKRRHRFGANLLVGAIGIILTVTVIDSGFNSKLLTGLVTRRVFMDDSVLTGLYFDFFSRYPQDQLAHSVLQGITYSPYKVAPAYLIGNAYFPGTGQDANANIWADAFANFGIPGMIMLTLVLACVLLLFDGAARFKDLRFTGTMLALPSVALANSGVLTTIASHGLGLAVILALLLPRDDPGGAPAATPSNDTRGKRPYSRLRREMTRTPYSHRTGGGATRE